MARSNDAWWICSALCAALVVAAGVLVVLGIEDRGVHAAVAATARLGFVFFWPAYVGSALVTLFGAAFQPLKQHVRQFGLAFASVLFVHLGLVACLCLIGATPTVLTFVFFGVGAAFAYLLALFSFDAPRRRLDPVYWRLLSKIGMNYIALAFFVDFFKQPLSGGIKRVIEYLPFTVFAAAGPGLRLAALALTRLNATHKLKRRRLANGSDEAVQ